MPMHSPPHVGAHIQDEIDFLGLSTAKAAEALGVSRQQLHRVLAGKSGISAEMAMRLEAVIGSTADHWMRLQGAYDLAQARQNKAKITKGLRRLTPAA
ncbi:MAG: HigA family addiction module antitoxin [Rhodobacteraceae bacterium]|jgi:addiction module HigA family antidote|nr:HigA family addiction module antitoxin [Paracoccaceae bacterium]